MKLAILGLAAAAFGVGLGLPGLIGIGAWWVVLGPFMRQHGKRLQEMQAASADNKPPTDVRTFAFGTLLWALLAVPSLLVGILEIGIDAEHDAWRWLPIGVGGFAAFIGGVGLVLYLTGSAVQTVADRLDDGAEATVPATLWIRATRETGTFVNERPRMELDLTVEPDAGTGVASYEVTKKATVPFTVLYALRPGDGFRAKVAGPDEPTSMEISWDEPVEGERKPVD